MAENATIELLKNYDASKMIWPAHLQEKHDGVPTRIIMIDGELQALTRQGERLLSVDHLLREASAWNMREGASFVGELMIPNTAFKDISGKVRGHEAAPQIQMHVFDFDMLNRPDFTYMERRDVFLNVLECDDDRAGAIRINPGVIVENHETAMHLHGVMMRNKPNAEGTVLHSVHKGFWPGKRCWGTQRIKDTPTIDLLIVGFEEAVSEETGEGLGMVGRVKAEFTKLVGGAKVTTVIGIGPGKLTHDERKRLWLRFLQKRYLPAIAEVKYMKDPTYEALRQPTFQQWRTDKRQADLHAA